MAKKMAKNICEKCRKAYEMEEEDDEMEGMGGVGILPKNVIKNNLCKCKKSKGKGGQGKLPELGSGKRFKNLTNKLEKKGAKNPEALAAYIGRKKFGKTKFQTLARKGKK